MAEPMIHAAIYARVSTEDQAKGFSLPAQVESCLAYAHTHGMTVHVSHIFRDDVTGAILERPALTALRGLAQTGRIQAIIAWKLDRVGRG